MNVSGHWQGSDFNVQPGNCPHHYPPSSVRSSASSGTRFSNNSVFSHQSWRGSVASTNTTWSNFSQSSRDHHVSQAQHVLTANSTSAIDSVSPHQDSQPPPARKRLPPRQSTTPADPFSTCVSRTERSRRSPKDHRYWCTSCKKGFREKYDWKRHEETYQERFETYHCDMCDKPYFLDKDFIHHHRESHRCKTCVKNTLHVDIARRKHRTRTGWGCGFCFRFDTAWNDRCNHIALHFERDQHTIADWSQTQVILSLLQQPNLRKEWDRLVESTQGPVPCNFGWSERSDGRAEGYPDSDRLPQLQDLLEFYTPDHDAAALVAHAYDKGHQSCIPHCRAHWQNTGQTRKPTPGNIHHHLHTPESVRSGKPASHSHRISSPEKALPPPPASPPVPPKDKNRHISAPTAMVPDHPPEFVPWDRLMGTILEDDFLADSVPLEFSGLDLDIPMHDNFYHF